MRKKLKIAHIHVWDKKNKGDVAIVVAIQDLLKQYLGSIQIVDFPVEFLREAKSLEIKKLNSCDLVVVGGGGIYYRYFMPYSVEIIKKIKKPIVIFGVGYIREVGARALTKTEKESIVFLNKKAELCSVRDNYSKEFLVSGGVDKKKIKVIGDPAVFLQEKKTKKIKLDNHIKIGLNLNYSGWRGFGKYKKEILESYERVAEYFQKKYKAKVYYLQHHPSEKVILKKLKVADIIKVDLSPYQQKYIYSQMDLIIGMMLHSCVLAFGAGTPEINVVYDVRNKNFAKFIKCPELTVNLDGLKQGELLKKSIEVFNKKKFYQEKFVSTKEKIWQKHEDFLNQINNLIK